MGKADYHRRPRRVHQRPDIKDYHAWRKLVRTPRFTRVLCRQVLQIRDAKLSELIDACLEWHRQAIVEGHDGFAGISPCSTRVDLRAINSATLAWLQGHPIWGSSTFFGISPDKVPKAALNKVASFLSYTSRQLLQQDTQRSIRETDRFPEVPRQRSTDQSSDLVQPYSRHGLQRGLGYVYTDLRRSSIRLMNVGRGKPISTFVVRKLLPNHSRDAIIDAFDVPFNAFRDYLGNTFREKCKISISEYKIYALPDMLQISNDDELASLLLDFMRGHFQDEDYCLCICLEHVRDVSQRQCKISAFSIRAIRSYAN